MRKRLLFFLLFLAFIPLAAYSQDSTEVLQKNNSPFKDRLFLGGSVGLNFGSITYVNVSPQIGVKVTDKFSTGVGVIYQYFRDNRAGYINVSQTILGGDVFARYTILDNIFLATNFQLLNVEVPFLNTSNDIYKENHTVPVLFLGGGLKQSVGGNSYVYISVLYDIIQDFYSPYYNSGNVLISGGVALGL